MSEVRGPQRLEVRVLVAGAFLAGAVVLGAAADAVVQFAAGDGRPAEGEPSQGATWGIAGPDFLVLYAAAVVVAALVVLLHRRQVWSRHARERSPSPERLPVAPVDIAYLTGGPSHAALAAHLHLHDRGLIEVPERLLAPDCTHAELVGAAATQPARPRVDGSAERRYRLHPVEATVLSSMRDGQPYRATVARAEASPEMAEVRDRLVADGLLVDAQLARRLRRGAFVMAVVVALGTARLIAGIRNERPVGWLVVLLAVAAAGLVAAAVVVPVHPPRAARMLAPLRRVSGTRDAALNLAWLGPAGVWLIAPGLAASFGFVRRQPAVSRSGGGWAAYGAGGVGGGCGGGGDAGGGGGGGCGGGGDGGGGGGCGG